MNTIQEKMWNILCGLDGETVTRLFTEYHGTQLLDEGFMEHIKEEGYAEQPICILILGDSRG